MIKTRGLTDEGLEKIFDEEYVTRGPFACNDVVPV